MVSFASALVLDWEFKKKTSAVSLSGNFGDNIFSKTITSADLLTLLEDIMDNSHKWWK